MFKRNAKCLMSLNIIIHFRHTYMGVKRKFNAMHRHVNCADQGWFMVLDTPGPTGGCPWETNCQYPVFLFVQTETYGTFGTAGLEYIYTIFITTYTLHNCVGLERKHRLFEVHGGCMCS